MYADLNHALSALESTADFTFLMTAVCSPRLTAIEPLIPKVKDYFSRIQEYRVQQKEYIPLIVFGAYYTSEIDKSLPYQNLEEIAAFCSSPPVDVLITERNYKTNPEFASVVLPKLCMLFVEPERYRHDPQLVMVENEKIDDISKIEWRRDQYYNLHNRTKQKVRMVSQREYFGKINKDKRPTIIHEIS